jgi:hypothetical protein
MRPTSTLPSSVLRLINFSDDGCWRWLGSCDKHGYGKFSPTHGRSGVLAHRHVYELLIGPIPADFDLDHLCRVITCVNPDHLEPVTHAENMRRRYEPQTHCKRGGHEFTPENTYTGQGRRACRACQRAAVARYKIRREATS